jgi:hypothetical protein
MPAANFTRSSKAPQSRENSTPRPPRKSIEDVTNQKENQDPSTPRKTPQPTDTENPPNENLNKDPDEAYGDTQIPHRNHRRH